MSAGARLPKSPWRMVAIGPVLLLATSLAVAQDPRPGPTPPRPPDTQDRSAREKRIEDLEGKLKEAEGALQAKNAELLESEERRRQEKQEYDKDRLFKAFMLLAGGVWVELPGDRDDDYWPVRGEGYVRGRLGLERDRLQQQRDQIRAELNRERYGSLTSFMHDDSVSASLGSGTNQFRDMVDPESEKPGESPKPQAPTSDQKKPALPDPQSSSVQPGAAPMSLASTAFLPTLVSTPALSEIRNLSFGSGAPSGGFTIFTRQPLTTQQNVNGWLEYRAGEDRVPLSGGVTLTSISPTRYSVLGRSGDGTAAFSGELQIRTKTFAEEFGGGGLTLNVVTKSGANEFHGSFDLRYPAPARGGGNESSPGNGASLVLTAPGLGGPVVRGNRYFFFDPAGRQVGSGSGTWSGFDGKCSLLFSGHSAGEPGLQLKLDYCADRATGAFQTLSGSYEFTTDAITGRTPFFWWELDDAPAQSRELAPDALATSVATYHGVLSSNLFAEVRETAKPQPPMETSWNTFETRLGFGNAWSVGGSNPLTSASHFLSGEQLNSADITSLQSDLTTQFGGARLIVRQGGRLTAAPALLARGAAEAVRPSLIAWSMIGGGWRLHDRPEVGQGRGAGASTPVVYFKSLGRSTGPDAIEMTYVGDTPLSANIDNLLVLEPVSKSEGKRVEKQIAQAARGRGVVMKLAMYCLNQKLLTPAPGQIMRLAGTAAHQKFVHVLPIWDAADRARHEGTLRPDSDPADYYHSIVQWAIWTKEQGYDEGSFGEAFAQHTRKNLESAGHKWSPQVESVVRGVVPNRWKDVQQVLKSAGL